jgi:hypothetical protein
MSSKHTSLRVEFDREELALMLSRIGFGLLVAFAAVIFTTALPLRFLALDWQLRITSALINNSLIAILGFVLICLAPVIDPFSGKLRQIKSRISFFALLAAVGYMLLIPLQLFALLGGLHKLEQQQNLQSRRATARIEQLRTAVKFAGSTEDLQRRLNEIQAPVLSEQDLQIPIAVLRSQILKNSAISEAAIKRRFAGIPGDRLWLMIMESARISLLSLAFAFAFASGAKLPGRESGVLDSCLSFWFRQARKLKQFRNKKSNKISDTDYIKMIRSRDDET